MVSWEYSSGCPKQHRIKPLPGPGDGFLIRCISFCCFPSLNVRQSPARAAGTQVDWFGKSRVGLKPTAWGQVVDLKSRSEVAVRQICFRHVMHSIGLLWDASCQIGSELSWYIKPMYLCTTAYRSISIQYDLSQLFQIFLTRPNVIGLKLNWASALATASHALKAGDSSFRVAVIPLSTRSATA